MEILATIIVLSLICVFMFIRHRRKMDNTLERIDVIEKEIEADARFFISAVYKSGRTVLITAQPLTQEQVYEESIKFIRADDNK